MEIPELISFMSFEICITAEQYIENMSTNSELLESSLPFSFEYASVTGRDHVRSGKNNQDGISVIHSHNATVAIVTDGCSSGTHNEIGATLGARLTCIETLRALNRYAPRSQHLLFDYPNHWEWREGIPERICAKLSTLIDSMEVANRALFIQDHLLFTIVGALITPEHTAFFSLGDGVMVVNGENIPLIIPEVNTPPYLAYRLVKTAISSQSLILNVNKVIATKDLEHFLLATDGLEHLRRHESSVLPGTDSLVGPTSQFWTENTFISNRDALRRRLAKITTDVVRMDGASGSITKHPGLLPDDTTVILGRKKEAIAS